MKATTQEKQNLSDLNQSRANNKQKPIKARTDEPSEGINAGELIIVLGAAITVDLIDILDLTGVGAILVRFIDIPVLGALWLWRIMKHQAGPQKDPTFQLLMAFLVEMSPFGMLPTWTIFVLYVYFQDTKLGKETIGKAQKLTKTTKTTQ